MGAAAAAGTFLPTSGIYFFEKQKTKPHHHLWRRRREGGGCRYFSGGEAWPEGESRAWSEEKEKGKAAAAAAPRHSRLFTTSRLGGGQRASPGRGQSLGEKNGERPRSRRFSCLARRPAAASKLGGRAGGGLLNEARFYLSIPPPPLTPLPSAAVAWQALLLLPPPSCISLSLLPPLRPFALFPRPQGLCDFTALHQLSPSSLA